MHQTSAARARRALLTVALGMALLGGTAAVAAADDQDQPSVIEFTVPDRAAIDHLNQLGFDLAEYQRPVDDGILINAVVDRQQALQLLAMGYKEGNVVESPEHFAAV